jgi:hypothetical protein
LDRRPPHSASARVLAPALWDGYEQWISVVGYVPAWGWLMMALGGGLSVALGGLNTNIL